MILLQIRLLKCSGNLGQKSQKLQQSKAKRCKIFTKWKSFPLVCVENEKLILLLS